MIEHPEAVTLSGQIATTLAGKRISQALRGDTPHKWAFYTGPPEQYATTLEGQTITGADPSGSLILIRLDGGHTLMLGGGGERLLYHPSPETVPAKHQLLLRFSDDTGKARGPKGVRPREHRLATHPHGDGRGH